MSETQTAPKIMSPDETHTVTDTDGRVLEIRKLNMIEEFDLIEMAGAENSANARWMAYATIVSCIRSIDSLPRPPMSKKGQLRDWMKRAGPAGYAAVVDALDLRVKDEDEDASEPDFKSQVKNSPSTPASAS